MESKYIQCRCDNCVKAKDRVVSAIRYAGYLIYGLSIAIIARIPWETPGNKFAYSSAYIYLIAMFLLILGSACLSGSLGKIQKYVEEREHRKLREKYGSH